MDTFWNGNKTAVRQRYEWALINLLLSKFNEHKSLSRDQTDYPNAEDEGKVLERGASALVTVAGNRKFEGRSFIEVKKPLCFGLLGRRVLVVKDNRVNEFEHLNQAALKKMKLGVPATWVDAELFRANDYHVVEQGSLEQMLAWLNEEKVDYLSLGVAEAQDVLNSYPEYSQDLTIETTLQLNYPFPLVFYVNQRQPELADMLSRAIDEIRQTGEFEALYKRYFGKVIEQLDLPNRTQIHLHNPLVPEGY
ncbi:MULTISPECIES: transporter substrate-binding domain-containing protein [unclassified Vibrio]|uniref:substrate-binding periplasmic protein n=1 Tax=unclassified Vibrio TaxID=2614977 RepID=UPI001F47DFCB|nr:MULTISPECIES: transporter substrate-binding domain-containing protein [unclassified Vibrio]QXL80363.1 transporter substrate-binding domain-containing protein [Vibrio sp.]